MLPKANSQRRKVELKVWLPEICLGVAIFCCWTSSSVTANRDLQIDGICQSKYIRNTVEDLNRLRGCKVIEGSLQISLIDSGDDESYKNLSFPELREITGYFLLFQVKGLTTLGNLFPNLAAIRGRELIHKYAFLISDMEDLQEIGLRSLTDIERGSVWIEGTPNLCYVHSIDWNNIVNASSYSLYNRIQGNELSGECPDRCPTYCPLSDLNEDSLCWNNANCQIVHSKTCYKRNGCYAPCMVNGECCNSECLGGCTGNGPDQCVACRNVIFRQKCQEACPGGFYEYMNRRCLTQEECLSIKGWPKSRNGKLYRDKIGKLFCVLECPQNAELSSNGKTCIPCDGACKKNCSSAVVESIAGAKVLAGCTRITGSLIIKIREPTVGNTLAVELKKNLGHIEEIDNFLIITSTHSIYTLDFLEKLKIIKGNVLDEERYALVVKFNENLVDLWNAPSDPQRTITIDNKEARVLFHFNPKLCLHKIWEFVNQAGIARPKDDALDISLTNGDKVICNGKLAVEVCRKTSTSVTIKWENFRRNLTESNRLLNYEVAYKEAPECPKNKVSIWNTEDWKVLDIPKMPDKDVQGLNQLQEPEWEYARMINGLKYFTWYALYVKTIVIPSATSPYSYNNPGAQSSLIYFQTLPDSPSKPREFRATANGPNEVSITWEAPLNPNGILENFKIFLKKLPNQYSSIIENYDYCRYGRPRPHKKLPLNFYSENDGKTTELNDDKISAKWSSKNNQRRFEQFEINLKEDVDEAILDEVFNPDSYRKLSKRMAKPSEVKRKREFLPEENLYPDSTPEKFFSVDYLPIGPKFITKSASGIAVEDVEHTAPKKVYKFVLIGLSHYTTYIIGIQACRKSADVSDIEDDVRTCSELVKATARTDALPNADIIDINTVSTKVVGNKLQLRWDDPKNPNGGVAAYRIDIAKVNSYSDSDRILKPCITMKRLQEMQRNFTFPEIFSPGNYSVAIKVISLAQNCNFSSLAYFYIEGDQPKSFKFELLIILLLLTLFIGVVGLVIFYWIGIKGCTLFAAAKIKNAGCKKNVNDADEENQALRNKSLDGNNDEEKKSGNGNVPE